MINIKKGREDEKLLILNANEAELFKSTFNIFSLLESMDFDDEEISYPRT
jgi:hypothetical protein